VAVSTQSSVQESDGVESTLGTPNSGRHRALRGRGAALPRSLCPPPPLPETGRPVTPEAVGGPSMPTGQTVQRIGCVQPEAVYGALRGKSPTRSSTSSYRRISGRPWPRWTTTCHRP
jgi:hypothetical protein